MDTLASLGMQMRSYRTRHTTTWFAMIGTVFVVRNTVYFDSNLYNTGCITYCGLVVHFIRKKCFDRCLHRTA